MICSYSQITPLEQNGAESGATEGLRQGQTTLENRYETDQLRHAILYALRNYQLASLA
jgi:hypothetical protein